MITVPVTPWMALAIVLPEDLTLGELLYGCRAGLLQAIGSGQSWSWRRPLAGCHLVEVA